MKPREFIVDGVNLNKVQETEKQTELMNLIKTLIKTLYRYPNTPADKVAEINRRIHIMKEEYLDIERSKVK